MKIFKATLILAIVFFKTLLNLCAYVIHKGIYLFLSIFTEVSKTSSSKYKSIYLLDEQGNEFIDDGVTFGYELDDAYRYRNRP